MTTAKIHDSYIASLHHDHKVVVDSQSSSALPLTSSRKTSSLWYCIHNTPNWPKGLEDPCRLGRFILFQYVTDFPTANTINSQTQRAKVIDEFHSCSAPLNLNVEPSWARVILSFSV